MTLIATTVAAVAAAATPFAAGPIGTVRPFSDFYEDLGENVRVNDPYSARETHDPFTRFFGTQASIREDLDRANIDNLKVFIEVAALPEGSGDADAATEIWTGAFGEHNADEANTVDVKLVRTR